MLRIFLLYITPVSSATGFKTVLKANSWQARLDKALLSVDLGTGSRLRLLNKAVRDPKLLEDVQASTKILVEKGFGKGHPQVINTLWPVGTTARADLEGLTALRKQVPEILEEAQKQPNKPTGTNSATAASGTDYYMALSLDELRQAAGRLLQRLRQQKTRPAE